MQSQCNYGSFLSKSDLHGTILYTMLAQNCPKGKIQSFKLEQFAISRWSTSNTGKQLWDVWDQVASINIKSSFALKEKKAYHSHWITLYQLNEQSKMHKGKDLDCKVLSVKMKHLNIFKYIFLESNLFGPELFTLSWDFIDSDNWYV